MRTLCIGVAGGTGSGKTTVADEIVRRVGSKRIVTVNQDRYYHDLAHLEDDERAHHNFDHPQAIEDRLLVEHLLLLKAGQSASLPCYDFARHVMGGAPTRQSARGHSHPRDSQSA
jgi:uridine kinase